MRLRQGSPKKWGKDSACGIVAGSFWMPAPLLAGLTFAFRLWEENLGSFSANMGHLFSVGSGSQHRRGTKVSIAACTDTHIHVRDTLNVFIYVKNICIDIYINFCRDYGRTAANRQLKLELKANVRLS